MQMSLEQNAWHKTVLKVVANPAIEVLAAIVVVLLAAWVVVQTETENRIPHLPVFSAVK
jgi:hypothetical protein